MDALRRLMGWSDPVAEFNFDITVDRVGCLADLITRPTRYVQRLAEQLSFVPTGGQQWVRTLQIQIPETSGSKQPDWWIIPLGQFSRKRFADLVARDAHGQRLNLLTRNQHGDALTDVLTTNYASQLDPASRALLPEEQPREAALLLRSLLFEYLTNLDVPPDDDDWTPGASKPVHQVSQQYKSLLLALKLSDSDSDARAQQFFKEVAEQTRTAPYLCWVKASPGEVISVQVTYSSTDPKHSLALGSLWDLFLSILKGLVPLWGKARSIRARWFRQYGLAPIDYAFDIPNQASTGSYYLRLQPPDNTICSYLDWAVDDSFNEEKEADGAFPSAHIHNNDPTHPETGTPADKGDRASEAIRAYLRCAPHHHKQILGATMLNVVVVWLLAKGELPIGFGEPLQALIAAAPSILIAFLAQQQRHYYSQVMRRQRAILWTYLFISVSFLVSVAFSAQSHSTHESGLPWLANIAAWVLAISSTGVFFWHLPLGGSYERVIKYLTDRKWEVAQPSQESLGPVRAFGFDVRKQWWKWWNVNFTTKWECYADAVRQYCCIICILVVASMGGAAFLLSEFADFSLKPQPRPPSGRPVFTNGQAPTSLPRPDTERIDLSPTW
ncbi:MAG TPA: hypothetical protein VLL27_13510 [Solirubrobacterales bacterium]|nr:hypothetical protein [Solirubrobacterales bacterium]